LRADGVLRREIECSLCCRPVPGRSGSEMRFKSPRQVPLQSRYQRCSSFRLLDSATIRARISKVCGKEIHRYADRSFSAVPNQRENSRGWTPEKVVLLLRRDAQVVRCWSTAVPTIASVAVRRTRATRPPSCDLAPNLMLDGGRSTRRKAGQIVAIRTE
jgi:hypothetical protein